MITNISPLDGRYARKLEPLREYFSEGALIKARINVEVEWLIFLCNELRLEGTRKLTTEEQGKLRTLYEGFDEADLKRYQRVKEIEKTTNHDVKAVEYMIKEHMEGDMKELLEFVHFACTSEDITNNSYSLLVKGALETIFIPQAEAVMARVEELAEEFKDVPMLSHTHGQPASPTTVGKEFKLFAKRLERQIKLLKKQEHLAKINGASGNYNAHVSAYPEVNWKQASKDFITGLGLTPNLYTAQIEPHDYMAEIFHTVIRMNNIVMDLDRDIWTYIGKGYFKQKVVKGEVGSSTMPHKVNPIDFENSEGNIGIANAIMEHMAGKLPISRMQRDLTDSTVLRNTGMGIGHSYLAYLSTMKGLSKLEINKPALERDLDANWEVLAEPIQTVMRKYKIEGAYEKLKDLTRGKRLTQDDMIAFVDTLEIPDEDKDRLREMTPATYIGLAAKL